MESYRVAEVIAKLSEPRLAAFRGCCENDESILRAYGWSLDLGQVLLKPIGIVEVAVRNSVDKALEEWWEAEKYPNTWVDVDSLAEPVAFLSPFVHASQWRKRAKSNKHDADKGVSHDDVIAHTSLGTWRNMIGNPAALASESPSDAEQAQSWSAAKRQDARCALLWQEVVRNAFPGIPLTKRERGGMSPRGYIGVRLTRVASLRNRVCHWDSLISVDVEQRYDDMKRLVEAVSSDLRRWMCQECDEEVEKCLAKMPSCLKVEAGPKNSQ